MKWAYGWGVYDTVYADDAERMKWKADIIKQMEEAGIENLGRISHAEVAELYKKAKVFLYPSEFAEIDCISLTKAMASGCIPVTTDFAAMGDKKNDIGYFLHSNKTKDTWCGDYQFYFSAPYSEEFVDCCVKALTENKNTSRLREETLEKYSWDLITNLWNNEI